MSYLSQWCADHINDMYADAVMAVVLQLQANPDLVCGCKHYKEIGNTHHLTLSSLCSGWQRGQQEEKRNQISG